MAAPVPVEPIATREDEVPATMAPPGGAPETLIIPETLDQGRYHIERVLGQGGTAVVLLARDARLGVYRAIKLMQPAWVRVDRNRARFRAEAFAQAGLGHNNVLMVHDVVEDAQGAYLVMELCEGDSLARRVQQHGTMSVDEVIDVGILIGGALAVAHAQGLVHRDIKPQNILVDRHGVLKLADFGIAHIDQPGAQLTAAEDVMGTWDYMPPEQRESSARVDPRSDVYAFGATLYALLTARRVSALHNPEAWAVAYGGVPPALAAVLQRATRLYPEDRFPDMNAMVAALHAARAAMLAPPPASGPALAAEPAAPGAAPPPSRAGLGVAVAVVLLAAAALAAGLWLRGGAAPVPAPTPPQTVDAGHTPTPAEHPAAAPADVPQAAAAPTPADAPVPAPAPPDAAAPSRPAPRPVPARRVIEVVGDSPADTPSAAPSAVPAPAAQDAEVRSAQTGTVRVRTIPSGGTVTVRGRAPVPAPGGGYALAVGQHTLELASPAGERTRLAVSVRAGQSVSVCWNFDTNSACGDSP